MSSYTIFISFLGGILPAILWLEFWLREAMHREPRRLILGTFLVSIFGVLVAGILEQSTNVILGETHGVINLFVWAFIEEIIKYIGPFVIALRTRFCDDKIDPVIYMITSALGFAAGENFLFLFEPIANGNFLQGLLTVSYRFVGATLLHVISSGLVGLLIGLALLKSKNQKRILTMIGLLLATILHTLFNGLIIMSDQHVLFAFSMVWVGLFVLIVILEKIKNTKRVIY